MFLPLSCIITNKSIHTYIIKPYDTKLECINVGRYLYYEGDITRRPLNKCVKLKLNVIIL